MAAEVERVEVRRELEELREEAEGHHDESSKDSDSLGLWRMESEGMEEWKSERWRSTMDLESEESGSSEGSEESEGSEPEVEKEMDKEVDEDMTLQ